jgi:hypothetical protein
MNYRKIYFDIVENRKIIPYQGYTEKHHILPRSLGGNDSNDNLVELSAKEHYICHLLLTKMYPANSREHFKMVKAFIMMLTCTSNNQSRFITGSRYQKLREQFSIIQSLSQSGEGNSQYGKQKTEEEKNKIRESVRKSWQARGYVDQSRVKEEQLKQKLLNKQKEVDLYKEYYIIYKQFGYSEFVKKTGYDKSKQNLVQRFKKLLPEFVPQNGKKRGS